MSSRDNRDDTMSRQKQEEMRKVLEDMARSKDGIVAVLADSLTHVVSEPNPEADAPPNFEVRKLISNLAGQLADTKQGPAKVV